MTKPPENDAHIHAEAEGYLREMTRWLVWRMGGVVLLAVAVAAGLLFVCLERR